MNSCYALEELVCRFQNHGVGLEADVQLDDARRPSQRLHRDARLHRGHRHLQEDDQASGLHPTSQKGLS